MKSNLFFDLGSLADPAAQIVKLGPADFTASDDLDFRYVGAMDGKYPFNSDAVRNTPYGESLGNAAPLAGNNYTLIILNTDLFALVDPNADSDGVADVELRHLCFEAGI